MRKKLFISAAVILGLVFLGALAARVLLSPTDPAEEEEFRPVEQYEEVAVPDEPLDKLVVYVDFLKNHVHADETIHLYKLLYNLGDIPLTIWGSGRILYFKVYDEQNQVVYSRLPSDSPPEDLFVLSLSPVEEKYLGKKVTEVRERAFFSLSRPGSYQIVDWAEIGSERIYADPAWLEIVTGEDVEFRPVEYHAEEALPDKVRSWVENSLKFPGHFANTKEYDGKQYLFIKSEIFGIEHFDRLVQIRDVLIMEEEVAVTVSYSKPAYGRQIPPEELYDVVYIAATGLPVRFVSLADDEIFIRSLTGIHYLPDIVANSGSIKLFFPAPGEVVGRTFSVSGVANAFEATVNYRLSDADLNILDGGFVTALQRAPGFTRDPVLKDEWLVGPGDWRYFTKEIQFPENVVGGTELFLSVFAPDMAGGEADGVFRIPLKLKSE